MTPNINSSKAMAIKAADYAEYQGRKFEETSTLMELPPVRTIIKLDWQDLEVGKMIGRGGFSAVYIVSFIDVNKVDELDPNHPELFALKKVSNNSMEDQNKFMRSAGDLILESKLLSRLQHENIVRLYGVKRGSASMSFRGNGYFLVYELLYDMLHRKISVWHKESGVCKRMLFPRKQKQLTITRLKISLEVAKGMNYLHRKNIIYRDVKPANVGFDEYRTVRIFDFGFAREMPKNLDPNKPHRKLTGRVGTAGYMAPEVARGKDYGLPVDVYSFGFFLYRLFSLKSIWPKNKPRDVFLHEIEKGPIHPPAITAKGLSPEFKLFIEKCINYEHPEKRPTFTEICVAIAKEGNSLSSRKLASKK